MAFLIMSKRELDKYEIVRRLIRRDINGPKAAELLQLSIRQTRRLKGRLIAGGAKALIHGNRGRVGNRRIQKRQKRSIIKLLHEHYPDFGPTLAAEKLAERHGIKKDPKTIRQIMIDERLWRPKTTPASPHRSWRQRKDAFGEMQQFDGSYEYWFEDRGPKACLLAAIDDATGRITKAEFAADEGVAPVFGFWREYLREHGRPRAIYLDKFSTYKMNPRFSEANHELKTQFERAMHELDVGIITAHSPQAKGRVERLFGTLQDRLIKELRLVGISTAPAANDFLKAIFLPKFNRQFAVSAASPVNLHRPLTARELSQLPAILSRQSLRCVNADFTISYHNQWYQLAKEQPATVRKKDRLTVEERLDDSIHLRLRGKYLNYKILPARPAKATTVPWVLAATSSPPPRKPLPSHPWKRAYLNSLLVKSN